MKSINLPTWLTLSRIGITPVIVALLYFPGKITCICATALYMAASFSDYLDGKLARGKGQVTSFGKFLDPLADKVLNCSMLIMMSMLGWVQAWVVIIIVCRELMITGLRAIAADSGLVMGADRFGKLKTLVQGVALVPLTLHYPFFGLNLHLAGEILLYFALALTIFSGGNYLHTFYSHWQAETDEGGPGEQAQSETGSGARAEAETGSGK